MYLTDINVCITVCQFTPSNKFKSYLQIYVYDNRWVGHITIDTYRIIFQGTPQHHGPYGIFK